MPISVALLTVALAQQAPEPPRTINNGVLGAAAEFATRGPARVCLTRTSIDVLADETAYLDYLGIHSGSIRVESPRGSFLVQEGDAWAEPRSEFQVVRQNADLEIERHRERRRSRYLFYGRSEYESARTRRVVWLEGSALTGSSRDATIYRRINVNLGEDAACNRRFNWGWGWLTGNEPMELTRRPQSE